MGFPKEAKFIADWSPSGGWPYRQFLQGKEFEQSFRFAIDNQTKELIGSNEQLLKRGFKLVDEDLRNGFSILSRDIAGVEQRLKAGTAEIESAVRWGFTVLAIRIQQMNQTLKEIKDLIQNPSWTWACEQFAKARDEYRRGLYPESLESITRAINGYGSNAGWNSEFRFHFLQGRIRIGGWIGSHPNTSPAVVDPASAEEAFLSAARYHRGGDPMVDSGKVQALLLAGRAAFVQGKLDQAAEYTEKALDELPLKVHPLRASGEFQLAKYLCARGIRQARAVRALSSALLLNIELVVDANADVDLVAARHEVLDVVISDTLKRLHEQFDPLEEKCRTELSRIRNFAFDGTSALSLLGAEFAALERDYDAVSKEAGNGGVLDLDSALEMVKVRVLKFDPLFGIFKKRYAEDRRQSWSNSTAGKAAQDAWARSAECASKLGEVEANFTTRSAGSKLSRWRFGFGAFFAFGLVMALGELASGHIEPFFGFALVYALLVCLFWWPKIAFLIDYSTLKVSITGARNNLQAAQAAAKQSQHVADEAWRPLKRKIDELEREPAPF